jgi:hypothetical protein
VTLRVGSVLLNVQGNTAHALDAIAERFDRFVTSRVEGKPRYSLRLEPRSSSGVDALHTLYDGSCLVARSRRADDALTALSQLLTEYSSARPQGLYLRAAFVAAPDSSLIVLPANARRPLALAERRLQRMGCRLLRHPLVSLSPATQGGGMRAGLPNADGAGVAYVPVVGVLVPSDGPGPRRLEVREAVPQLLSWFDQSKQSDAFRAAVGLSRLAVRASGGRPVEDVLDLLASSHLAGAGTERAEGPTA